MNWMEFAQDVLLEHYGLRGELQELPGELDHNFKVKTADAQYILKISDPRIDPRSLSFQEHILDQIQQSEVHAPQFVPDKTGVKIIKIDAENKVFYIRLLTWLDGHLWANLHYHSKRLLNSLGIEAGKITAALTGFDDPFAHRKFDWDIDNAGWIKEYLQNFTGEEKDLITYFYNGFEKIRPTLDKTRKSVVHNDANDYNILVSSDYETVAAIIDYGDSVFTSTINDLAIAITYAVMGKTDPLEAAVEVVRGYHLSFSLKEDELEILYWLVGARLVISLTKSMINKNKEPDNPYLLISEKPAWALIKKWRKLNPLIAKAFFRNACGFHAHRDFEKLSIYLLKNRTSLESLIGTTKTRNIDLDITSKLIYDLRTIKDQKKFTGHLKQLWADGGSVPLIGGYNEVRPELLIDDFRKETNEGAFWEALQLGIQIWDFKNYKVTTPFEGIVLGLKSDAIYLMHKVENLTFYLVYKNLKPNPNLHIGHPAAGEIGIFKVEEDYRPLFFQLTLLNPLEIGPQRSCIFEEGMVYRELMPNPTLLFHELQTIKREENDMIVGYRKVHLGKSLSISYDEPLQMIRGDGMYLIDQTGRQYLDMVNNVAHVGHEHPDVVKAGQVQMALLNTNSRYLHDEIIEFAQNLLATFPKELSVVNFVNSGSEANELAMRMAKTYTHQKDFIAVQVAYHGNSNACIDISSYKFDGKGGEGAPEHTHVVPLPDTFRGKYTGAGAGEKYASHVQLEIEKLARLGRKPAAFISESIISTGGQIELPDGYLRRVYEYVHAVGGLCIADEIQIGCGRVGKTFWGFQLHGVQPDIVTIGKPIGNGHPLAALVCTQEVADAFANGMEYFNTFGGNPVSCAIGNEVLKVIKRERLQENALTTGGYLKAHLNALKAQFPIIADVRGQGLFLGFELCDSQKNPLTSQAAYLTDRMKTLGILLSPDGPDHNVMKLKPPIIFNQKQASEFLSKLELVLNEEQMQL